MSNNHFSNQKPSFFAEVIESSLDHYTAQCWEWDRFPSFGSLMQVQDKQHTFLGVVTHIKTGSIDPTRSPFPYQKTEEELRAQQPQIFEFLKTTFTVQILGYQELATSKTYYLVPPTPCKIHAFVAPCDATTTKNFFASPHFVQLLFAFASNLPSLDELLLAIIKQLVDLQAFDQSKLDQFCQSFTLMTGNDYRRLKTFLKRVESMP
jgi:hypothetical protein